MASSYGIEVTWIIILLSLKKYKYHKHINTYNNTITGKKSLISSLQNKNHRQSVQNTDQFNMKWRKCTHYIFQITNFFQRFNGVNNNSRVTFCCSQENCLCRTLSQFWFIPSNCIYQMSLRRETEREQPFSRTGQHNIGGLSLWSQQIVLSTWQIFGVHFLMYYDWLVTEMYLGSTYSMYNKNEENKLI